MTAGTSILIDLLFLNYCAALIGHCLNVVMLLILVVFIYKTRPILSGWIMVVISRVVSHNPMHCIKEQDSRSKESLRSVLQDNEKDSNASMENEPGLCGISHHLCTYQCSNLVLSF